MYLAKQFGAYRLNDIAKAFGLGHYGSVSNAISLLAGEGAGGSKVRKSVKLLLSIDLPPLPHSFLIEAGFKLSKFPA